MARQRTFTSYYSSLENARGAGAGGSAIACQSHQINRTTPRQHHSHFIEQKPRCQDPSLKDIVRAVRYNSSSELFESPTSICSENLECQQTAALTQIKDNYSRNLATLSGSLDLIKVASSTAAKLFADSKTKTLLNMGMRPFRYGSYGGEGFQSSGAKSAAPMGKVSNKSEASSIKEYILLKLNKKRTNCGNLNETNFANTCDNRFAAN